MPNGFELLLVGLFSGALAGTLGAGGGFATVVLLLALGVDAHAAVGTSLLYAACVATWATVVHLRQRTTNLRLGLTLGIPAAVTAIAGAQLGHSLSDRVLTVSFGVLAAVVGITALLLPARNRGTERRRLQGERPVMPVSGAQDIRGRRPVVPAARHVSLKAAAGGAGVGFAQGLFGVGGGFLFVPLMIFGLRVPEHVSIGTSLTALVIGGVSGSVRHIMLGNIRGSLLVYLLPAGIVGGYIGAKVSRRLSPALLRGAFVVLLLTAAAYLFVHSG